MAFTLILMVVGGSGNVLFTLLGSVCFEATHYFLNKKTTLKPQDDSEIPPAIPSAENFPE